MILLMLAVGIALGSAVTYAVLLKSSNAAEDELKAVKQEAHQTIMESRGLAEARKNQASDLKEEIQALKNEISNKERELKASQKKQQEETLALSKRIVELETLYVSARKQLETKEEELNLLKSMLYKKVKNLDVVLDNVVDLESRRKENTIKKKVS